MRIFGVLFLLFLGIACCAQNYTPNIGFESGTFKNWECYVGNIDSLGNISMSLSEPIENRHTMVDKGSYPSIDKYGKFPTLCPVGGKYSIRLGNPSVGAQAERVSYTFTVPKVTSYSIIFYYAVVLQNPDHESFQQPRFTAKVYDIIADKYIECPAFNFIAGYNLPGFKLSTEVGVLDVYYKDWASATINLTRFAGKQMRLEFTTNDCTKKGHFGYAYLDASEVIGNDGITGNSYCTGQRHVTLQAPPGFETYSWYNADFTKQLGKGQQFTISPPPPDLTGYTVVVKPFEGLGCPDTLHTIVNRIDKDFKLQVLDTIYACPGTFVDLTAVSVTAGSSAGMNLSYFTDSIATKYLYNPDKIKNSGQYYIRGTNNDGCTNILPVTVIFDAPHIDTADPSPVVFPVTVDLSKTYRPLAGYSYSYYTDSEAKSPLVNYSKIVYGGNFYIKATNHTGCTITVKINVVINPPPPYQVTAPNTFTPNNDGINDHFLVTVTGEVSFTNVQIFNRYGQLVFTTKSPITYWDGNFNGRSMPAGTYYWVFEGVDEFYRKKIFKGGYIVILR